jgi:superfamily II DNA or RNA helicase
MYIEVGKLKSKIVTDNPKLLAALCDIYAVKIKGAEYSQAYRRRRWDGKKHFITAAGYFKNGLLEDILNTLKKIDCIPKIKSYKGHNSDSSTPKLKKINGFKYYDYQEELIRTALKDKNCVIESATASGKTVIMAGIIKSLGNRKMLILFSEKQILKQTYDFFVNECKLKNIGINYGEDFLYGDIMLSTVQSIENILDTHLEETELLMIDEVHEFANGDTRIAAIESFPSATYRIGMTATVPKDKIPYYNLVGALGPVRKIITTQELVEKGTLVKPLIQLIPIDYKDHVYDDDDPYIEIYKKYIIQNKFRNGIIKTITDKAQKIKTNRIVIIVQNIEHGKTLAKAIPNSKYIRGNDNISERYQAINDFRSGKYTCLIGTKILQTGVNIKEITHLINARGLQSYIATLQALGRALRSHESKTMVYIYDFMDINIKFLEKHSKKRKSHYKKEGHNIEVLEKVNYEEQD